ncbi:MAG: Uncharacterised protein [SAR116 cluster bacterium]|nr:MAG: Uncharacterised protein [SAR116 cluster bacterium]
MFTPHLAIEEIHAQLLAAICPVRKAFGRTHETVIIADLDGNIMLVLPVPHGGQNTVFTGFGDDELTHLMAADGTRHLSTKAAAVGRIVQTHIINLDALGAQGVGKMAHCRKQKGHLALVMADIGDFLNHLGHQHHIACRVQVSKAGQVACQLVTKHQSQDATHAVSRNLAKAASASSRDCFRSTTGRG